VAWSRRAIVQKAHENKAEQQLPRFPWPQLHLPPLSSILSTIMHGAFDDIATPIPNIAVKSQLLPLSLRQLEPHEQLASFRETFWGRQELGLHNVLQEYTIRRDDASPQRLDATVCDVPGRCLAFEGFDMGLHNLAYALVRQEYVEGLNIINEFSKRPREILSHHFATESSEDPIPQQLSRHFTDGDTEGSSDRGGGVSVVGYPGTGKSIFLKYALLTRLLARRTTVWADGSNMYIFTAEGVFEAANVTNALARELSFYLPTSTWVLVDSSPSTPDVPDYLLCLNLFILQAACSRPNSFDWLTRTNRVATKYHMKPWDLAELIAARDLHLGSVNTLSELDIAMNYDIFGPSPRAVFTACSLNSFHRTALDCAGQLRSESALIDCIHRMKRNEFRDDCHKLLVVQPGSRRDEPQVVARTRYACKVLEYEGLQRVYTLVDKLHAPAEFVLESIIRKQFTRGGQFVLGTVKAAPLEGIKGKVMPPTSWMFQVPTAEYFRICANPDAWLRVGYRNEPAIDISTDGDLAAASVVASPVDAVTPFTPYNLVPMTREASAASAPRVPLARSTSESRAYYRWLAHPGEVPPSEPEIVPPTPVSIHQPNMHDSHHSEKDPLRTGFIPPISRYAPPYDFIAYDADHNSAIVLQAFHASEQQAFTLSVQGVKWLQSRGVQKISFIVVLLGPHLGRTIEFRQVAAPLLHPDVDIYVSLHDLYGKPWARP